MNIKEKLKSTFLIRALINIKQGLPFPPQYSKLKIVFDYLFSAWFGKYTLEEYMYSYKFYSLSTKDRKKYISNYKNHKIQAKINSVNRIECFRNKSEFNNLFSKFINRKWIYIPNSTKEEFIAFCKNGTDKFDLICKPVDSSMGRGIFKTSCAQALENIDTLYKKFKKEKYIIEECLIAHNELSDYHPASLNTIRIVTLKRAKKAEIVVACLRTGNNAAVVDNAHAGGIWAIIDPSSGEIAYNGVDSLGRRYETHPYSGKKFKGIRIPHWDEIVTKAIAISEVYPQAVIAGWDIVVCKDNHIELIEGNSKPDIDFIQSGTNNGWKKQVLSWMQ